VYDLSQGMARMMSMAFVGKQVDIIPHSGIVVHWPGSSSKEYFFGGGICVTAAGQSMPMQPCEVIELGAAKKTEAELEAFLSSVSGRFTQESYNLLNHNCNHFANEVARFITAGEYGVPDRIVNIAHEALSSPQGQQLRGMIEGMEANMRQQQAGSQFNPMGHVQSQYGGASQQPAATPAAVQDLTELRTALEEMAKVDLEPRRECLSTVAKLVNNIIAHPMEMKYKKVKMGNPAFVKRVADVEGSTELMLALGFLPEEIEGVDHWVWGSEPAKSDLAYLDASVSDLQDRLANFPPKA